MSDLFTADKLKKFRNTRLDLALNAAVVPVAERLENRWLMAGNPNAIQSIPLALSFGGSGGGLADTNGVATGFTWAMPNATGTEYQPSLLNVNTTAGTLTITTTGTAAAGGPWEGDNSQVDVLQDEFNGAAGTFTASTRLIGPLSNLANPSEQGGVILGPDDDNYVKFVAVSTPSGPELQFVDEQKTATGYLHAINANNSYTSIGSFSAVNTLDLEIAANPSTGVVNGFYSVNGGALAEVDQSVTLSGAEKTAFFNSATRAGIIAMAKNNLAPINVAFGNFAVKSGAPASLLPTVVDATPGEGNTGVSRDAAIGCDLALPYVGQGVNPNTLYNNNVALYRTADMKLIASTVNTDGAGGTIILQPNSPLDANTNYTFVVTNRVQDLAGHPFLPFTTTFTTGSRINASNPKIAFQKVSLPTATGQTYTGVTMGPDGMLYACTYTGLIQRFAINSDGTLGTPQNITTVQTANGGDRSITGMAFDPASTANNLIMWISNNAYVPDISGQSNAPDFSGKITVLSGANLENYQDVVTGLPRSVRDHLTEQPTFGPDGALYVCQSSNSSMGAPDSQWGLRSEHLLSAAILRIDTTALMQRITNGQGPLNVQTTDAGGTYNPYATGAPVTIYATGVRNAYSMVWATNGKLYAPVNGASYGGATPSAPNSVPVIAPNVADPQTVQGIADVTQTEDDFLDEIVPGGYYGHPDPVRGQYVLDAGNPTTVPASSANSQVFSQYPIGTNPDPGFQDPVYNFGQHYSPDGIIQYEGNAFGGALNNALMVTRYSEGKDVEIMYLNSSGGIASVQTGVAGLTDFIDPLGIAEDQSTGNIYVADYGAQTLMLLRPIASGAQASVSTHSLHMQSSPGGAASTVQNFTLTNNGTGILAIPADGLTVSGPDATQFLLATEPALPLTIAPGASITIGVSFIPPAGDSFGLHTATMVLQTNDPNNLAIVVNLYGLATGATVSPLPAPTNLTATATTSAITLNWTPVTAGNIAGYNVYSSTSPTGTFTLLNTSGPLPSAQTSFTDTSAQTGVTTYYQLTAVDSSNAASPAAAANATEPASGSLPPGSGTLTATGTAVGITLNWTVSTASILAGYNVYSSPSANGPFTQLNLSGLLPPSQLSFTDSSATPGVVMYYEVTAVDGSSNESLPATASAAMPITVPLAPPTNLLANASGSGVSLTWDASVSGTVEGYQVYRAASQNGTYTLISGSLVSQTTFSDSTAPQGQTSYYEVFAVDNSENLSSPVTASAKRNSPTPTPTPTPTPAPAAVAGLSAQPTNGGVVVSWSANTEGDISRYDVYRSLSSTGVWVQIGTATSSTTFTDAMAAAGRTWYYQVYAIDKSGRASPPPVTASAQVTFNATPPAQPAAFTATGGVAMITLNWQANTELDLAGYVVFRSSSPAGGWIQVGGTQTGTSFVDRTAPMGQTSYYLIVAINTSNIASAVSTVASANSSSDPTPPPVLTGIAAVGESTGNALSWSASPIGDLQGYLVYRSYYPKQRFVLVTSSPIQQTGFLDTTAAVRVRAYYRIVAVNTSGISGAVVTTSAVRKPKPTVARGK